MRNVASVQQALPVCVAYPAGFDWTFLYVYMLRYTGKSPFSFSAIDIKTYAMATLRSGYREVSKRAMLKSWFDENLPHTHKALDDAIEQGALFCNMMKYNLSKPA